MHILSLKGIRINYNGIKALDLNGAAVKREVVIDKGKIVVLLGPNGAGKTTLLKAIFGLNKITSGEIIWEGEKISPESRKMRKLGISYVGQNRRVFESMSVLENIETGGIYISSRKILRERIDEVLRLFPELKSRLKDSAGRLSGGQQQMVAIARELVSHPKLLLLDEPSLGLSPKVLKRVLRVVKNINSEREMAALIVEHNVKSALSIADYVYILDKGRVVFYGSPEDVVSNKVLEDIFMNKDVDIR